MGNGTMRWSIGLRLFVMCCVVTPAMLFPTTTRAATRCVNPGGTGGCFASIQAAVNASSSGDSITVAAGTYAELVTVGISLTISGAGAAILDGGSQSGNTTRVLAITGGTVTISGLTIRNGYGGGVLNGGTLSFVRCVVTGNLAKRGGGIDNTGAMTLIDSTVAGNNASDFLGGVGVGIHNSGTLTISAGAIRNNSSSGGFGDIDASKGGSIYNSGSLTIGGTTLDANYVRNSGGGIYNDASGTAQMTAATISGNIANGAIGGGGGGIFNVGTATVTQSVVRGNAAGFGQNVGGIGGGINNSGMLTIIASTISGNSAGGGAGKDGGGIFNEPSGQVTVTNSTISGNSAAGGISHDGRGGALDNRGAASLTNATLANNTNDALGGDGIATSGAGTTTLRATLLANGGANCLGPVASQDFNLASDASCAGLGQPHDQVEANPLLGPLAANGGLTATHALMAGSPAIDAGGLPCAPGITADQRGFARPFGAACDIGAYEYSVPGVAPGSRPGPVPPPPPPAPVPQPRGVVVPTPPPPPPPHPHNPKPTAG